MSLASDAYTLVTQGARLSANWETVAEFPHFVHDLLLGASREPKDPHSVYTDLHLHIPRTASLRHVIDEASKRVDICSIVTREQRIAQTGGYLDFDTAVAKCDRERIDVDYIDDRMVKIRHNGKPFIFVRAIEVYAKEHQELVIVGNDREFSDDSINTVVLDDLIHAATDVGALWFLDHPMSIEAPVISFRYPTEEELRRTERWFDTHHPLVETGNHQNTLWMYPSNVLARRVARKYGLPQITNSDSHMRIPEIGLSRTKIPRHHIDDSSGDALVASLNRTLRERSYVVELESGYSSIWAFTQFMVLPTVLWRLGFNEAARRVRGIED